MGRKRRHREEVERPNYQHQKAREVRYYCPSCGESTDQWSHRRGETWVWRHWRWNPITAYSLSDEDFSDDDRLCPGGRVNPDKDRAP